MVGRAVLGTAVAVLCLGGCGRSEQTAAAPEGRPQMGVTSRDLVDGGRVPVRFTCDGEDISPQLQWSGVPTDAGATAIVVDDPDAPHGPFAHWVVVDIPVDVTSTPRGGAPQGGVQATTSAGDAGWTGPCPPPGAAHHYRFTVYALSDRTNLAPGADLADALAAIDDHQVAWGRLTATYVRRGS